MIAWPDNTHLPDQAFVLPREPTPAVIQVLRLMPWQTIPISRVLQRAGFSVPTRTEDEQAHVMFFLLPYAIAFGDDWWVQAHAQLSIINGGAVAPGKEPS